MNANNKNDDSSNKPNPKNRRNAPRGGKRPSNRNSDNRQSDKRRSDNRRPDNKRSDNKRPDKRRSDSRNKPSSRPEQKKSTNIKITRPPQGNENWQRGMKTTILWIVILVSVFLFAQVLNTDSDPVRKIGYTEYQELLESGKIKSAIIRSNHFHGELNSPEIGVINGVETEYTKFWVVLQPVIDSETTAKWDEMGIAYEFEDETRDWVDYLFQVLPWVLIIFFWFFLMRRMQSGGGTKGIFSFGKSRAKIIDTENPKITFKDVAGCEEAKDELREIVQFLKHPNKFQRLGGRIPKGALLVGPPGTGKTLLAKAVAGEASVPFYSLSGADFVEMFVGVGASRVRDLFEQSKKTSPCIIFIDELDAVGRQRGAGLGGGHDEREQTLNALLVEMDGFETTDNIILLAATNRPDVLDAALLRPGRFDRRIMVDTPDVRGREAILKVHAKDIPMAKNVRLDVIAKGTPGMSGADLANLINEAALIAAKHNKQRVAMIDIENAKDKIMMGTERRSMVINEKEKRTTAIHEAGHALVARYTEGADPVHRVTIIPRGRALGLTAQLPVDDRYNYSREYMEGMLAILMGGRVAEQVVLDQMTTGAGNDIERATSIARKMVTEWGMSDKMGPMTYGQKKEEIFIGRDLGMHRDFSEDMAKKIDAEVRSIVDKAYKTAKDIITRHKDKLLAVSEVLLDKESVDAKQLDNILGLNGGPGKVEKSDQNRRASSRQRSRPPRNRPSRPKADEGAKTSDKSDKRPTSEAPSTGSKPDANTQKESSRENQRSDQKKKQDSAKQTSNPEQGNLLDLPKENPTQESDGPKDPQNND
ncbi:MAG: ATP-dependent zinc metalloprotease FtsH [Candidatus Marinimicrobia bacterium]|nr:ATP-dependent zinc metalloprotease FtsH [Candidatus Neomarinimicrobiota bacterium]MCF7851208.1 ATP-dependent zinc metalloprotease FtsH [Candidatus Neomarinimicrobiota bacterium]MCF7904134.1 ATP-dependent zinc metalloprotease FtsH [Candidatus Neomarinimicrobiota bacterium]